MAYGKIKVDSIIYDNSGSNVEKTVESLTTPEGTAVKSTGVSGITSFLRSDGDGTCSWNAVTPEGTLVLSTGESGTAKFLRVDGDGTCSWQVPPDTNTQLSTEQVQDIVGAMVTGNTETGIAVTYEDGDGTLDFVVSTPALATEATNVAVLANNSTDETVYLTFVDGATGTQGIETDTGLTYNPSTGLLSTAAVTTTGNVIVGGNLTVSGSTTTVNTATLEVEDKNIELGKVSSPSDTTADGGGITLKGASDKTFNWVDTTDAWTSSEHIHVGDNKKLLVGSGGAADLSIYHDGTNSFIKNGTGHLKICDANVRLMNGAGDEDMIHAIQDGAVELYHNNVKKIETTAAGVTVTGSVTDDKGELRTIPQLSKSSQHTIVLADAGKHSINSSGGWILNTSTAFTAGMAITLINNSGSDQTITATGVTLYNTADAATGNRTLAGRGMATVICTASNTYYISGAGLS